MQIRKQTASKTSTQPKLRSYAEIVEFLDKHWSVPTTDKTLDKIKQLDAAFNNPSKKVPAIMVAGTNGKSITTHLTIKLLKAEGLKVGGYFAPHILTYNERMTVNHEAISNKLFTDYGNDVINTAEELGIEVHTSEVLAMMAILFFAQEKVDVAVLEIDKGGAVNPLNICTAIAATITRITPSNTTVSDDQLPAIITETMGIVKKNTWLVSGDQCKMHLELMNSLCDAQGGHWAMPIRKLAPLAYPFEQLHGRCAALAERLAHMFMEHYYNKDATITADSLLSKQKGTRGRPTIEAKKKAELNPRITLDQFWKEELNELPSRFQILDKEKPSVLLDTATNNDAFANLLLGVRLLHYQRPLKGLAIIMAASKTAMQSEEFLKQVRYFFKKTAGHLLICPIENSIPGTNEDTSWDTEQVVNDVKIYKVKARMCKNFNEAFETAKKLVDERAGLIVITGSNSIINTYWRTKGVKKF